MLVKYFVPGLLFVVVAMGVNVPVQAAMVSTAQLQAGGLVGDSADLNAKRDWITQQLIAGGVENGVAKQRVTTLTNTQVLKIHQRIDQEAAGGNTLVIIFLILVITELMGVTDIVPNWPAN